jgi:hypothetical protein
MFGIAVCEDFSDLNPEQSVPSNLIIPMCNSRLCLFAAFAAATCTSMFGMNNTDVIKMKEADFSDDTILLSIGKEPADYDTSTDALISLKKAGVSETVIQKMIAAQHGAKGEATGSATEPAPAESSSAAFFNEEFPTIAPPMINPIAGKDYFLRSTMHFEDGKYVGTNYARGTVVPINTPVRIEAILGKTITLRRTDTGDHLTIENVDKYTRKSIDELASTLFAEVQTPLDRLPAELAASIRSGDMRKGMTKEQVLMARGYPPAHETVSADSDRWVFWSSRFVKQTIVFNSDGRLVDGRGIY